MFGPKVVPKGPRHVVWEGEEYLFFGGNDYHRFAFDEEVIEASIEASRRWGLNLSGSRTTSANHPLYEELEAELASFLRCGEVAVCSAGYMSNAILIQATQEDYSHILIDQLAHSSLADATQVSRLPVVAFDHRSAESLSQKLAELPSQARSLVLTDGVFASSGAIAPLAQYAGQKAAVIVDDAHGLGVLGGRGEGTWASNGLSPNQMHQTGTLSKALGGFGGIIASDKETIQAVKSKSCALTGSTPMPIPMAAAALKSLEILGRSTNLIETLQRRAEFVKARLRELGFSVSEGPAPICSVTFHDASKNNALAIILRKAGIYPNFIDYPGCPPGGHFRFTLSSRHTDEDIERLVSTVAYACESLNR